MARELVLIDLSSIAHPIWHVSQSEPDPNHTSQQIVARVRSLATGHPHAAICCDSGRSFRREIAATYKANRPAHDAALQHQVMLAREQLAADGFPVWAVASFEADDLIATATTRALADPDVTVLIVSADKDLLQLVGPRVRAMNARDGAILDVDGVKAKFGVAPEQVRDYLSLVGDTADNVKGAPGIGPKKAAELLAQHGTIDGIYTALATHGSLFKPAIATSLKTFMADVDTTRKLITLRADADLPFEEIHADRVEKQRETFGDFGAEDMEEERELDSSEATQALRDVLGSALAANVTRKDDPTPPDTAKPADSQPTGLIVREPDAVLAAPAEWERGLDPRSMKDARMLAKDMFESRMFSAYGSPQAVLSTVMVGRELGLPAMASLRSVHVIEGRHALAASLMVALVLRSGLAEFFEPIEFTDTYATYETKRKGARNAVKLTHTLEMAVQAGLVKDKSGWAKNPTDMLVARASARLARMVYPDLLAGLYTPEELAEIRETVAA